MKKGKTVPIYESLCGKCGRPHEYYATAANCYDTPTCCGERTTKMILTPPFGQVDIPAYVSPVTGRLINSRTQRKEDLLRTGSRPWEGMEQETKEAQRRAAYEEKKQDAKLEEAVVAAWHQLPSEKRQALEAAA